MIFEMVKQMVWGFLGAAELATAGYLTGLPRRRPKAPTATASIVVDAGKANCAVDVDSVPGGTTGSTGSLTVKGIEAGGHYVHVRCPGEAESTNFISPKPGEKAEVQPKAPGAPGTDGNPTPLQRAESKTELRTIVQRASDERADGRFDEAVKDLRYAATLDPENPDLHRELGITFLLQKEWQPARVEMLEALRHDPDDADAHSNLGFALERLGDYKDSLDQYRIATHLDPEDDSYRQHYMEVLGKFAVQQDALKHKKR